MGAGGDRDDSDVTSKTPSFLEELKGPDPWQQVTPVDFGAAEATLTAEPAIDAEYAVDDEPFVEDPPSDEDGFTEAVAVWEEVEDVPEGDGPFAVPVDEPRRRDNPALDLINEAFGPHPPPGPPTRLGVPLSYGPRALNFEAPPDLSAQMGEQPHVMQRRVPKTSRHPPSKSTKTRRQYPRMLALLKDSTVAERPGRLTPDLPPPVPGTFFPAPREPMERPEPTDLDQMLATMAEGLLIGETPDGQTEVRVTLKDEFFAGTELRIAVGEGKVHAVLVPPSRDVYWQLNASLDGLKDRLTQRGLAVEDIELVEP